MQVNRPKGGRIAGFIDYNVNNCMYNVKKRGKAAAEVGPRPESELPEPENRRPYSTSSWLQSPAEHCQQYRDLV